MRKFRETLAEGNEAALHLGPERARVYTNLLLEEKDRVDIIKVRGTMQGVQVLLNSEYFKDKMVLIQAQENVVALDEDQLLFIAGGQETIVDEDVDEQPFQDLALNVDNIFQANDCDAFDSDVDKAPTT
nr:retrovirus-related Pol polyprotein from transposon TNT 1-94 [Tanacetum cinerariifolium]